MFFVETDADTDWKLVLIKLIRSVLVLLCLWCCVLDGKHLAHMA